MGDRGSRRWPLALLALCLGISVLASQSPESAPAQYGMLAALGALPSVLLAYCAQASGALGLRRTGALTTSSAAQSKPSLVLSRPVQLAALAPALVAWLALGVFAARRAGWHETSDLLSVSPVAHALFVLLLLAPLGVLVAGCLVLLSPRAAARLGLLRGAPYGRASPLLACSLALAVGPLALTQAAPLAVGVSPLPPSASLALTPLALPLGMALSALSSLIRATGAKQPLNSSDRWQGFWLALIDRVIVYTLLILPLFAFALGAGILVGRFLGDHSLARVALSALTLAAVASVAYAPLHAWVQRGVDSFVYRDSYAFDETLQRVSQGLASLQRQDEIANYLLDILMETLNLSGIAFVYLPDGLDRRLLNMLEASDIRVRGVYATSSGAENILEGLRALDVERLALTWRAPLYRDPWPGWAALLMIGAGRSSEARALVILAPKRSHSPFRREDCALLATIASQTATALANAQLIDGLRISLSQTEVASSQLAQAKADRELMLRELVGADDRQRAALARELHDDALQDALYVARHSQLCVRLAEDALHAIEPIETSDGGGEMASEEITDTSEGASSPGQPHKRQAASQMLRRMLNEADHVIARAHLVERKLRALCLGLYPETLNSLGLAAALNELAERAQEEMPAIEVSSFSDGLAAGIGQRLNREAALHVYRIAQEALQNASKHGGATAIALRLTTDLSAQPSINSTGDARLAGQLGASAGRMPQALILEARDDGQGMPLPIDYGGLLREGRLGLAGMRERAEALGATLRFQQGLGGGSVMTLSVPLSERVLDHLDRDHVEQTTLSTEKRTRASQAPDPGAAEAPMRIFQVFPLNGAYDPSSHGTTTDG